jgi:peptide deformylase
MEPCKPFSTTWPQPCTVRPASAWPRPQVGIGQSFVIYDIAPREEGQDLHVLVNPKILSSEGEILSENEGCLSVPDFRADVKRNERILVEGR